MSGGVVSEGSDGYDEEEDEEFAEDQLRRRQSLAELGLEKRLAVGTYESMDSNNQQQKSGSKNRSRGQRMDKGFPNDAAPFFVLNSFPHHPAAAIRVPAISGASSRDAAPDSLSNYYTTLLTGSCFKGHYSSLQQQSVEQSLKQILSDPISGELMDDATIFPCGHSFGSGGVQKIQETNLCHICQMPTRVADGNLNLALRAAVQAFRIDRGFPKSGSSRAAKRRRDTDCEQTCDGVRPKGVQFPYVVSDKVLIKGNKRTPERFVGKQAIITTQCLNGWYLVRTIDNGESVRLQYRSLQKIEDDTDWQPQDSIVAAEVLASVDLSAQIVDKSCV